MHGASGVGKGFLARRLQDHFGHSRCTLFSATALFAKEVGGSECMLVRAFGGSSALSPADGAASYQAASSIIIIDDIDVICSPPLHGGGGDPVTIGMAAVFNALLDSTFATKAVLVIGITGRLDSISADAARSGRLYHAICVSVSTVSQRRAVLDEMVPLAAFAEADGREEVLQSVATATHGYSPSDLARVYAVAFQQALSLSPDEAISLSMCHFTAAISSVKPSIMAGLPSVPRCHASSPFRKLIGMEDAMQQIVDAVMLPIAFGDHVRLSKISPPRGILIWGEGGCGKTELALQCIQRCAINAIHVQAPSIRSKYVGDSEKALAALFSRARECAPCIVFIDQLDALFSSRQGKASDRQGGGGSDRLITCFLTELDGITARRSGDGVIVIGATSRREAIDEAILRPGRLGVHIQVPSLQHQERLRKEFILDRTSQTPTDMKPSDVDALAAATGGWSASALDGLFSEAALTTLRANIEARTIATETLMAAVAAGSDRR